MYYEDSMLDIYKCTTSWYYENTRKIGDVLYCCDIVFLLHYIPEYTVKTV